MVRSAHQELREWETIAFKLACEAWDRYRDAGDPPLAVAARGARECLEWAEVSPDVNASVPDIRARCERAERMNESVIVLRFENLSMDRTRERRYTVKQNRKTRALSLNTDALCAGLHTWIREYREALKADARTEARETARCERAKALAYALECQLVPMFPHDLHWDHCRVQQGIGTRMVLYFGGEPERIDCADDFYRVYVKGWILKVELSFDPNRTNVTMHFTDQRNMTPDPIAYAGAFLRVLDAVTSELRGKLAAIAEGARWTA